MDHPRIRTVSLIIPDFHFPTCGEDRVEHTGLVLLTHVDEYELCIRSCTTVRKANTLRIGCHSGQFYHHLRPLTLRRLTSICIRQCASAIVEARAIELCSYRRRKLRRISPSFPFDIDCRDSLPYPRRRLRTSYTIVYDPVLRK